MKGKVLFILSGVTLFHLFLLCGILMTGGCASSSSEEKSAAQTLSDENLEVAAPGKTPSFQPPATRESPVKYTVKKGDSIGKIAKAYGVSASALAAANKLDAKKPLYVGKSLIIPAAKGAHLSPADAKTGLDTSAAAKAGGATYVVQKGDSLAKIASKNGVKLAALTSANGLDVKKPIKVGQKLVIPGKDASAVAAPAKKAEKKDAKKKVAAKKDTKDTKAAAAPKAAAAAPAKPATPAAPKAAVPAKPAAPATPAAPAVKKDSKKDGSDILDEIPDPDVESNKN